MDGLWVKYGDKIDKTKVNDYWGELNSKAYPCSAAAFDDIEKNARKGKEEDGKENNSGAFDDIF